MKFNTIFRIFLLVLFCSYLVYAQNSKFKKNTTASNSGLLKTAAASGDSVTFKDSNGNTLIKITDEGTTGSITIPPGATPSITTNKLYNIGSTLYFNGSSLGSGSGAASLNDLSDAKTDASNVFLGSGSGASDGGSNYNTATGINVLHSNTTGYYNTANGYQALYSNTTGIKNTANGLDALYNNTTGSENTATGYTALNNNTTGNYNTANGLEALSTNTTGEYNTANGSYALYFSKTGSDGVAVGYQSQFYTNNTTTAFNNQNTSVGYQSLMGSTMPANNTGNSNSAFGYQALYINTTGKINTSIGAYTLYSNTTGTGNTANGEAALYSNTTGIFNTANGDVSLYSNTTGSDNTANGRFSLYHNTTGNYNTANGSYALYSNTTGSDNTAVGYEADVGSGNLTNATAIGYAAFVTASNTIQLGNSNITAIYAKVGITATSDSTKKENFQKVDEEKVLDKFRNFRLTSWNFKGDNPKTQRHYGIMAQDFFSAFGHDAMGTIGNDTTINVMDEAGVNMIAIQALEKRSDKQALEISNLKTEVKELKKLNAEVKMQDTRLDNEFESLKIVVNKLANQRDKVNVTYK